MFGCDIFAFWGDGMDGGVKVERCGDWEIGEEFKRCTKCGEVKEREEFNKEKRKKDGLNIHCKECSKKYYNKKIQNVVEDSIDSYKACTKCGKQKVMSDFPRSKGHKGGFNTHCKECKNSRLRKTRNNDPQLMEGNRERCREYYNIRKNDPLWMEKKAKQSKEYRKDPKNQQRHKDYLKEYYKDPDNIRQAQKARREYWERHKDDPHFKLNHNIATSMRLSLKNISGCSFSRWEDLVGYTVDDLKKHLEKQFTDGMSWSNYTLYGWHIDHRVPKSIFNYTKPEHLDFKRCWSLDNLQPMWATENLSKGTKITEHFQIGLALEVEE